MNSNQKLSVDINNARGREDVYCGCRITTFKTLATFAIIVVIGVTRPGLLDATILRFREFLGLGLLFLAISLATGGEPPC
jgi:hypothetical protein